jgi:hypothetical protein
MLVGNVKKKFKEAFGFDLQIYELLSPEDKSTLASLRKKALSTDKEDKEIQGDEQATEKESESDQEWKTNLDEMNDDQLETYCKKLYKPITGEAEMRGIYVEARLTMVRNDWDPDSDMDIENEISFWSGDTPIFQNRNGDLLEDDKSIIDFDIFFDEDSERRFISISALPGILEDKNCLTVELLTECMEHDYNVFELLVRRVIMKTMSENEENIQLLTYLFKNPSDGIDEIEMDQPENWVFQIGNGDKLYCDNVEKAQGAIFLDFVFSNDAPFVISEGSVEFDDESAELDDTRDESKRLVALIKTE